MAFGIGNVAQAQYGGPDIGDLGAPALGFGLDQISSAIGYSRARKMARRDRRWREQMASTAYQRTMADMRAAGLNPILAASRGATPMAGAGPAGIGGGPSGYASAASSSRDSTTRRRLANQQRATLGAQESAAWASASANQHLAILNSARAAVEHARAEGITSDNVEKKMWADTWRTMGLPGFMSYHAGSAAMTGARFIRGRAAVLRAYKKAASRAHPARRSNPNNLTTGKPTVFGRTKPRGSVLP